MLTKWISQNSPERRLRLPRGSRSLASQQHRFRPRLEGLEGRTVLSTLTVLNTLDKGAGSLRDTITNAKNGEPDLQQLPKGTGRRPDGGPRAGLLVAG